MKTYTMFGYFVVMFLSTVLADTDYSISYLDIKGPDEFKICEPGLLYCFASPSNSIIKWTLNGEVLNETKLLNHTMADDKVISGVHIECPQIQDAGNYSCHAYLPQNTGIHDNKTVLVNVVMDGVIHPTDRTAEVGKSTALVCEIWGYPLSGVEWKIGKSGLKELLPHNIKTVLVNETYAVTKLNFTSLNQYDNGTYICSAVGPRGVFNSSVHMFVLSPPQIKIDSVKAVASHMLYLNWTVNDGNAPITEYAVMFMNNRTNTAWTYHREKISGGNTGFLLRDLEKNTAYKVRLIAVNRVGNASYTYDEFVTTLSKDPVFSPTVKVPGTTYDTVTISWDNPPPDVRDYVHVYKIKKHDGNKTYETVKPASDRQPNSFNSLYLFENLQAATTYAFSISACNEYTKMCSNFSETVNGTTLDGLSEPPENLTVQCRFDNISHASFVSVSWAPPKKPNGKILTYSVVLEGMAMFRNEKGVMQNQTWGPKDKSCKENSTSARFDASLSPNTNYTIKISGVTRSKKKGKEAVKKCTMPPTVPDLSRHARFLWSKVQVEGNWLFRLELQRLSERNGPVCCYVVCLIKLKPGEGTNDLPPPEEVPLVTFQEAHSDKFGAYIADTFDSYSLESPVFLGDNKFSRLSDSQCQKCVSLTRKVEATTTLPSTDDLALAEIPGLAPPTSDNPVSSEVPETTVKSVRRRRFGRSPGMIVISESSRVPVEIASDEYLDSNSNYTGFIKVLVFGEHGNFLPSYSSYFTPMMPGYQVVDSPAGSELTLALYVLITLVVIVLFLLVVLFVLHNYTRSVAQQQGIEMTFTNTLMHLCRNVGGRHVPVSSSPPDMPPISKEDLEAAVAERHRDSDYGFQREFEMLPDRFPDRTTRSSELRDNFYKNRYPDIKAYDQTRVKLSQVDGIMGSDYINANFVVSYKERKKFICAQGPMDNTVNDFWRMVWEQHLEMILMLTNLEEYNKTKCAKYWPDEGEKKYGDFVVTHIQEKRFSDYIVRELKLRQISDVTNEKDTGDERSIVQYHFLVWKDFQAPDHPSGILKFIKRINEDYSLEKGPILIHCSAGVGRTGTLVAIDSLVQQINEENQVAIFNTVCDLRHQRNFLVQSLKQYIFVYRALLEVSQSGDTELKVNQLKSTFEKLRKRENGKDKCLLEEEFDKLELVVEERTKSWSVGGNEENKAKNKSSDVIPYDRNRVMLSPIPGKEHSTYINASFIEGYDNSESFVIAQDPLPNTLSDFWRMVSEHCVSTLVMISDLGDGPKKCIRYWPEPDDESTYNNIRVKYIQSESCPYYTRREFAVTNIKTDDSIITTQFQYNGWPTVEGEVPEVTRGLIELVDQTQENHMLTVAEGNPGPVAVHCNIGAERSSMFVALSILIQQLNTEKRVDIFSTVRKLRSQRPLMVNTYAQYEFIHRAVLNYSELHHMAENGTMPVG